MQIIGIRHIYISDVIVRQIGRYGRNFGPLKSCRYCLKKDGDKRFRAHSLFLLLKGGYC